MISALLTCNIARAELTILAEGFDPHTNLVTEFENSTGEQVTILSSSFSDNLDRLKHYNKPEVISQPNSVKPDLIIAKDIVYLAQLKQEGFTQAFDASPLFAEIKTGMMDSIDNHWVGLSYRARTLAYGSNVDVSSIETYEDLAKPEWAGRLCVRTSNSSYNYGLVSYLITEYGEAKASDILLGWMDNLAQPVFSSDGQILTALNAGVCDVGIVNHYYLAREYAKAQAEGTTFNVNIKFLNQGHGGVHTNGYGIALLKTSQNKDLALQFVNSLLSEKAQIQISSSQFAYPVINGLKAQTPIQSWGDFETSPLIWSEVGQNLDAAKQLILDVDYK